MRNYRAIHKREAGAGCDVVLGRFGEHPRTTPPLCARHVGLVWGRSKVATSGSESRVLTARRGQRLDVAAFSGTLGELPLVDRSGGLYFFVFFF